MAGKKRRRNSRKNQPHRPLDPSVLRGLRTTEIGGDGFPYQVQIVGPSQRTFTCPGCGRQVGPGVEHIVAWPEEAPFGTEVGADARRHWHTSCWRRKLRPL